MWEGGDLDKGSETQISQSVTSSPFNEGDSWLETSFAPRNRRRRREGKEGSRSDSEKEGGGRSDTSTSSLTRSSVSIASSKKGRRGEKEDNRSSDTENSGSKSARSVVIKENAASKKIIVKNVAWGATDIELKKLLSEAGEVISFQGMKDNEGKDRGHRVVEYKTRSEANKARKTLNNRELK
jgi:RNA recognition motif-containing protein